MALQKRGAPLGGTRHKMLEATGRVRLGLAAFKRKDASVTR
jgi:hypothetical protein